MAARRPEGSAVTEFHPLEPADSWSPSDATLSAFAEREFRCHHCGAEGTESRGTDQVRGPVRHRLGAGRLLLPFCPACGLDHPRRREAEAALRRAVRGGDLAWVDPAVLPAYRCPVADCPRPVWHHLGAPLPLPVVADPPGSVPHRRWHPCPWCVGEDPVGALQSHQRWAQAVVDLRRWEAELLDPPD